MTSYDPAHHLEAECAYGDGCVGCETPEYRAATTTPAAAGYGWLLTDALWLGYDPESYRVTARNGSGRMATLTALDDLANGGVELLINGNRVDVGDDLPAFLGLVDAAADGVTYLDPEES